MSCSWEQVPLGVSGNERLREMRVTPLGLGSSYGLSTRDVERAIDRGVNYIYWGAYRRPSYARAIRNVGSARREKLALVVQTYTRVGRLMRVSLEWALRELGTEYIDLLLLGWWNHLPPRGIVDAALELKAEGKVRGILVSCHHRPSFEGYIEDPAYDAIMVRYNAAHTGAEQEVFPLLARRRVGVVAFTATRWGTLLDPRHTPPGERTPRASDCYRFALSNPAVDVSLAGPKDGAELDEALSALDQGPLSQDELAWMRRVGAGVRQATMHNKATQLGDRMVDWLSRLSHVWER